MPTFAFSASAAGVTNPNKNGLITVLWDSFEQSSITQIQGTIDASADAGGTTSFEIEAFLPDVGGASWYGVAYPAYGSGIAWPAGGGFINLPAGTTRVQVRCYSRGGDAQTDSATISISGNWIGTSAAGGACVYGVQANPDATIYQVVTDSLIDLVVGAALVGSAPYVIPLVETALAGLEGSIWLGVNCAVLPYGTPNLDLSNLQNLTRENLWAWFQNAAWRFFCQCVPAPPGNSPAVNPSPPTVTLPPDVPTTPQPIAVCDNTDLCTYLMALKREVEQTLAQIGYVRADVQLIQRQHVPFAYVRGTLHTGLSGSGTIAVQGILGIAIQATSVPESIGRTLDDVQSYFNLGWVTFGTTDGFIRSEPVTHNPQLVLPVGGEVTEIAYSFPPLVVVNIQEFVREP